MTLLLVILDGAAESKKKSPGDMSPLRSARMPNLGEIASSSLKGMIYPIAKGIAPESDAAVFSILGYDVASYTGRGPLEAYGAGLKVDEKSIAFRCNFATIDKDRNIIDRRAGRIEGGDAKSLEREVNGIELGMRDVRFRFKATAGHRGVCVFYSKKLPLSANVSNADIGYTKKGNISVASKSRSRALPEVRPLDGSEGAANAAMIANMFIEQAIRMLSSSRINSSRAKRGLLRANALLLRDGGVGLPKVSAFESKHGMRCAFIAEMPVEIGIARLLGMDPIKLRPIKDRKRRYEMMAELVNRNVGSYDFIYVHIKGPDEPGHDGDARLKKEILEEIDSAFFSRIKDLSTDMCITCDHATPCRLKAHSSDPVPVIIRYSGRNAADPLAFDEEIGDRGGAGVMNGNELIDYIIRGRANAK